MTEENLKHRIQQDTQQAMRARASRQLRALRLLLAAIKQREVDERIAALDDTQVIAVIEKMIKQRRDAVAQFQAGNRPDLVEQENFEIDLLKGYLPAPLDDAAIYPLVQAAIAQTGATTPQDMGKVMAVLKPQVQGRADMGRLSALVKQRLLGK